MTAAYISPPASIPTRCIIFNQSTVPAHAELAWLLGCLTPLGWLNRMTQFKEKAGKERDEAGLGLYAYPVLMAADILVYKATHVPVGEDQKQHLELARDIAGAFNRRYGVEFFPLPEPQIFGAGTRVMSLRDGTKKMSKSDTSDYSRINMTDDADTIALKIGARPRPTRAAARDIEDEAGKRPEADNLLGIYAALSGLTRAEAIAKFAGAILRLQGRAGGPGGRDAGQHRRRDAPADGRSRLYRRRAEPRRCARQRHRLAGDARRVRHHGAAQALAPHPPRLL